MSSKNLFLLTIFGLLLGVPRCTSKPQTYTGVVTTTMCGTHHFSGLTPTACVRKCIQEGSQYALVVGDTLYKLDRNTAGLDAYAGERASVFGAARSDTIHVTLVSAPKSQG
jgi:hypothetical protein